MTGTLVTIAARHGATARTDDERYLCLRVGDRHVVIPDRCKHRGGPLSLGEWDAARECMTCPWHGMRNTRDELLARALPAVRIGATIVAVVVF